MGDSSGVSAKIEQLIGVFWDIRKFEFRVFAKSPRFIAPNFFVVFEFFYTDFQKNQEINTE